MTTTREQFTVYEYPRGDQDNADEISWHYTFDAAVKAATKAHDRTGLAYRIDFDQMEGSIREGWTPIYSDADRWGIVEAWTPPVIPGREATR